MSILDLAKADTQSIIRGDEWGIAIELFPPSNATPFTVTGLTTSHSNTLDPDDGSRVHEPQIHINIVQDDIISNYPNAIVNGKITLEGWVCNWTDGNNETREYTIREVEPDMKLGIITCFLELTENDC